LHPECLSVMLNEYGATGAGVYSDYIGKAYVENPEDLASNLQEEMLDYDPETKIAVIEYKISDFDCDLAMKQPRNPPYIWNNITTLIPKAWHIEIGGFDETMKSWEDVDYWWRMAWSGKCFVHIPRPLMVYRFGTGDRRDIGVANWDELLKYLSNKKREMGYHGM